MKSKRVTVFLLCIGTCFSIFSQEGEELFEDEKPVVAVVLAGGGALGYAHVGALKVMEEEGIQPDLVLGSSMGSIIGALYCAGYTPDELQSLIESADWKHILLGGVNRNRLSFTAKNRRSENLISLSLRGDIEPYEAGLSSAQHVVEFLDELLLTYNREMSFDDLPVPFRPIGTDLLTGERIIYSSGDLKTAIRGSMAVPGIFTPVFYDDRYIIDGGWADNLPATVARSMGADIVISVSLYGMIEKIEELNSLSAVTYQADQIRTRERLARSIDASDLVIAPNLLSFTPADFEKGSELIEKGYEAASLKRDELKAIGDRVGEGSRPIGRYALKDERIGISEVAVNGNTDSLLGLRIGEYIKVQYQGAPSGSELQDYIYSFYNSGEYDHIWYQLIPDGKDGFVLLVDAPEKTYIDTLGLSLNFTSPLSRTELSDYEIKTEITLNRGKKKQDFFSAGLLLSQFPSIYGNWEKHSLGGGFIWGAGAYNYNTPFYSFRDGTVDSHYAINSFGAELTFKIPLLSIMSFGSSIYTQYSILDYRSGNHTIDYDDWIREGIRLTAAIDTLDRIIAPRSGINALFEYDISRDRINEILGKGRTAGELFIPFFSKSIIGEFSWETYLTHRGEYELLETGYAGQAIGIDGFYPQELRDYNILMGRIGLRVKIGELPLGLGNEIYFQTRINGVTLWENVLREYADPYAFSGGSAGLLLNTIIGELYLSGSVNSENRFGLNLSLTSTRLLNKGL